MNLFRLPQMIKRLFRKFIHPFKSIKNFARRNIKTHAQRVVSAAIIAYLSALIPANYILGGLANNVSLSNPTQIIQTVSAHGLPNFLSLGLGSPISGTIDNVTKGFESFTGLDFLGGITSGVNDFFGNNNPVKTNENNNAIHTLENDGFDDWNESTAPNYAMEIGRASVDHDTNAGTINYGGLDNLGRTTWAAGRITYQMVADSAGWREKFGADADEITGWKNPTTGKSNNGKVTVELYNGKTYTGYFYNRSHLVADSLGGAPKRENLVTGTRMQNVGANDGKGGMAYTETIARDYLKNNPNQTLYYSATPVYYQNEIVPRVIIVDMKSSDGSIDMEVEVFNSQKGYTIDYTTGAWSKN